MSLQKKKNQLNTKEGSNRGYEGQKKAIMYTENKQQKSFLISNYFKYAWIKLSNQNVQIAMMDKNDATI